MFDVINAIKVGSDDKYFFQDNFQLYNFFWTAFFEIPFGKNKILITGEVIINLWSEKIEDCPKKVVQKSFQKRVKKSKSVPKMAIKQW